MYLPSDFLIVPVRLVVAQWWEYCSRTDLPCSNDSPVLAVRSIGGVLSITQDLDHRYIVLYQEKRDLPKKWIDLHFEVRFSPRPDGQVRAWLQDKQVRQLQRHHGEYSQLRDRLSRSQLLSIQDGSLPERHASANDDLSR
jgi:Polysaccharide lyase